MQPAIILDIQKEFLTEATSAPKLFLDLGKDYRAQAPAWECNR